MKLIFLLFFVNLAKYCTMDQQEHRVYGGAEVPITEVPHAAAMTVTWKVMSPEARNRSLCGSSIIHKSLVLTAAHCLDDRNFTRELTKIEFVIGNADRNTPKNNFGEKYIIHENYSPDTQQHDLAMVKLGIKLEFDSTKRRVFVSRYFPEIKSLYIAGWGRFNDTLVGMKTTSRYVKRGDMMIVPCKKVYKVPPGFFCARNDSNSIYEGYSGKGDSGSGVIANGKILVGVVSYAIFRELKAYVNATCHYNWILKTMRRLLLNEKPYKNVTCLLA